MLRTKGRNIMKLTWQPLTTLLSLVSLSGMATAQTIMPYETVPFDPTSPGVWNNCFKSESYFDYIISTEMYPSGPAGAVVLQGSSGGKLKFCRTAYISGPETLQAINYGDGPVHASFNKMSRGDAGPAYMLSAHQCIQGWVPAGMMLQMLSTEKKRTQIQVNNGPVSFVVTVDPTGVDMYDAGVQLTYGEDLEYHVCALEETTEVHLTVTHEGLGGEALDVVKWI